MLHLLCQGARRSARAASMPIGVALLAFAPLGCREGSSTAENSADGPAAGPAAGPATDSAQSPAESPAQQGSNAPLSSHPAFERVDAPGATAGGASPGDFAPIVARLLPSIVFIQTESAPSDGLRRQLPRGVSLPDTVPTGVGSGIIFKKDGHILTNNHVVEDADRVLVVLHDRRYFEARVVGRDPSTEIAVVRIEAPDLTPATFGDSDALQLGDGVIAMGSPLGLQFSVTAGIVSGTGRSLGILEPQMASGEVAIAPVEHFIQTDAALSPGNSGGPLVNRAGEVIGINTAVAGGGPLPMGFGFSIPSNLARRVAEQLIQRGQVRRSYLGVAFANVSPAVARSHGLSRVEGAVVVGLEKDGPADRAGLREGDVVQKIGSVPVQTVSELQAQLAVLEPGSKLVLRLVRERKGLDVEVVLGEVRSGVRP